MNQALFITWMQIARSSCNKRASKEAQKKLLTVFGNEAEIINFQRMNKLKFNANGRRLNRIKQCGK